MRGKYTVILICLTLLSAVSCYLGTEIPEEKLESPTIEVMGKTTSGYIVSLYSANGTEIYYTLDGSDPFSGNSNINPYTYTETKSSHVFQNTQKVGIIVPDGDVIKAITRGGDYLDSDIASLYPNDTMLPKTSPPAIIDHGHYINDRSKKIIEITGESGCTFAYTTSDKLPWSFSNTYIEGTYQGTDGKTYKGMLFDTGILLKTISMKDGYMPSEPVLTDIVSMCSNAPLIRYRGVLSSDTDKRIIEIISSEYSTVYYTTDGSDPTDLSQVYTPSALYSTDGSTYQGVAITVSATEPTTIKAVSITPGQMTSEVSHLSLSNETSPITAPSISVEGICNDNLGTSIVSINGTGQIRYTLDGTEPSSDSPLYNPSDFKDVYGRSLSGIAVPANTIVKAISCSPEGVASNTRSYRHEPKITIELESGDYGWKVSEAGDQTVSGYIRLESTNQNINSSSALMKITFNTSDSYTFHIRSYAEGSCDYVRISKLNSSASSMNVNSTTRNNSNPGTGIEAYTAVPYSMAYSGNWLYVEYVKDISNSYNDDTGYILINSNYL